MPEGVTESQMSTQANSCSLNVCHHVTFEPGKIQGTRRRPDHSLPNTHQEEVLLQESWKGISSFFMIIHGISFQAKTSQWAY